MVARNIVKASIEDHGKKIHIALIHWAVKLYLMYTFSISCIYGDSLEIHFYCVTLSEGLLSVIVWLTWNLTGNFTVIFFCCILHQQMWRHLHSAAVQVTSPLSMDPWAQCRWTSQKRDKQWTTLFYQWLWQPHQLTWSTLTDSCRYYNTWCECGSSVFSCSCTCYLN